MVTALVITVCLGFGSACFIWSTWPVWRPLWRLLMSWEPVYVEEDDAPQPLPKARVVTRDHARFCDEPGCCRRPYG